MTFDTKLTMALAGCSGSCSANRWHTLSVALPCFLATNPKTLQETSLGLSSQHSVQQHTCIITHICTTQACRIKLSHSSNMGAIATAPTEGYDVPSTSLETWSPPCPLVLGNCREKEH